MTERRITTIHPALTSASIGFDNIFKSLVAGGEVGNSYPPYNIVQISDDAYAIEIAVAGFKMEDLSITVDKNVLKIKGSPKASDDSEKYLHRGIARRSFERVFTLAQHIEIGAATLEDGMLTIALSRVVPPELQPKQIEIKQL